MSLNQEEIRSRKRTRFKAWYAAKRANGEDPIGKRARGRKGFLVRLVGGCQFCQYDRCDDNLAFHHFGRKEAGLTIKAFQRSSKKLVPEIRKCVIACHNCHGEIHRGIVSKDEVRIKHKLFQERFERSLEEFLNL